MYLHDTGANLGRSANWLLASQREIEAISNLKADEDAALGDLPLDVAVPKVFYPAYEFRSYNAVDPEPQRAPQLLLYKGSVVRVNIVTVAMRMWGDKANKAKPKPSPEGVVVEKAAHIKVIYAEQTEPASNIHFTATSLTERIVLKNNKNSILELVHVPGSVKLVGGFPGELHVKLTDSSLAAW